MPRVHIGGLGQDETFGFDVPGSFTSSPGPIGVPLADEPAYVPSSGTIDIGPPLPSGAFTTATATPSDIAWAQQNAQFESTSFAPGGITSYGTLSPTANPFAQSAASIAAGIVGASAPSPRISTSPATPATSIWTSSSLIHGVPDIAILGVLAVGLIAFASTRKR